MSGWGLAIDYGTSFSAAAVVGGDGVVEVVEVEDARRLASGVVVGEDGLLIGKTAVNQARRRPERFERCPKRLVGKRAVLVDGQAVKVAEMVAVVLERMVSAARTRQGGSEPDWVRLTHPASWREDRVGVLREAARRAGITDCELLSEPEAAAWFFVADRRGHEPVVEVGQSVAVYDLGGGTFDTAILRRGEQGFSLVGEPGGDDWLGGEDFDQKLLDLVLDHIYDRDEVVWRQLLEPSTVAWRRAKTLLADDVRTAKEALSSTPRFTIAVGEEEPIDIEITRGEFEELIRDDLARTIGVLDATIRKAGLTRDQIAAVYLTGGSSRIPLVADLLTQYHLHTYTRPDPKTLVAQGATQRATSAPPTIDRPLTRELKTEPRLPPNGEPAITASGSTVPEVQPRVDAPTARRWWSYLQSAIVLLPAWWSGTREPSAPPTIARPPTREPKTEPRLPPNGESASTASGSAVPEAQPRVDAPTAPRWWRGTPQIAIALLLALATVVGVAALVNGDGGPGGDAIGDGGPGGDAIGRPLTGSDLEKVPTEDRYAEEYRELLQTIPAEIAQDCEPSDVRDEGVAASYKCVVHGLSVTYDKYLDAGQMRSSWAYLTRTIIERNSESFGPTTCPTEPRSSGALFERREAVARGRWSDSGGSGEYICYHDMGAHIDWTNEDAQVIANIFGPPGGLQQQRDAVMRAWKAAR